MVEASEDRRRRERAGRALAGLFAVDGLVHLYWATGLTWPAPDERALSLAVLGGVVSFAPRVVLPLALLGLVTAVTLYARGRGRGGWFGAVAAWAVTAGLFARGLLGLVWAFGAGDPFAGAAFHWLNLFLYTPLCLGFGWVAATGLLGPWPRRLLALPLVLVTLLAGTAYGYQPAEERGYAAPADSQWLETPVARFHYVRKGPGPGSGTGTGTPVVLLSPGASWTFAWREQVEALSRTHPVYVVDLPGQGFTELRDRSLTWDLDGMTKAVGSFLDGAGIERAALAGNSWSGGWALAYAQRHPERVSRLALLASSGLDERDPRLWEAMKLPLAGELLTGLGAGRAAAESSVRRLFVNRERVTGEIVDAAWAPGTREVNRKAVYRLERGLDWRETEAALPSTRQPVLVLWGRQDSVLPSWQAGRFGELLPDARVEVLDGCGHALTLDCPDRVNAELEEFLG
ncbi:alpha/beta fold hydrolase [Streptomyces sp. NPDC048603]|uniref:alpha/beta fold hydrolase n=1 Tax=Streptomyces sp. NPDC048603 TaxID=3365577 RepID=UPI00371EF406